MYVIDIPFYTTQRIHTDGALIEYAKLCAKPTLRFLHIYIYSNFLFYTYNRVLGIHKNNNHQQ